MEYLFSPLWQQLSPIILKTNHRQMDDKAYGDICNRLRIGALTESDIATLNSRVFPKKFQNLPDDSIFTSGTNKIVSDYNNKNLMNKLLLVNHLKQRFLVKHKKR